MAVTTHLLEFQIKILNERRGAPATAYTQTKGGPLVANVGHYCLEKVTGGFHLVRMANEGGAMSNESAGGPKSKREMFDLLVTLNNMLFTIVEEK